MPPRGSPCSTRCCRSAASTPTRAACSNNTLPSSDGVRCAGVSWMVLLLRGAAGGLTVQRRARPHHGFPTDARTHARRLVGVVHTAVFSRSCVGLTCGRYSPAANPTRRLGYRGTDGWMGGWAFLRVERVMGAMRCSRRTACLSNSQGQTPLHSHHLGFFHVSHGTVFLCSGLAAASSPHVDVPARWPARTLTGGGPLTGVCAGGAERGDGGLVDAGGA